MKKEKKVKQKGKTRKIFEGIGTALIVVLAVFFSFVLIVSTVEKKKEGGNPNAPTKIGNFYFPLIVSTDSMEPDYMTKSSIFIKKQSIQSIYDDWKNGETVDLTFNDCYKAVVPYDDVDLRETLKENNINVYDVPDFRTTLYTPKGTMTHRCIFILVNNQLEEGQGKYLFFVRGINTNSKAGSGAGQYQVFTENELYGRVVGNSKFVGFIFTAAESPLGLIVLLLIPCIYMIFSSILEIYHANDDDDNDAKVVNTDDSNTPESLSSLSEKDKERLKKELLEQMLNKGDK